MTGTNTSLMTPRTATETPKSLRILHLTASLSRRGGGLLPIVQRLSQVHQESGSHVSVMGLEDEFSEQDLPGWAPLTPKTFSIWPPKAFGYAPRLRRAIREAYPDLVHVHGLWMYPSWANLASSVAAKRPYVVSPQGMLDPWALANSRLKKRLVAAVFEDRHLRNAGCLHALAPAERAAMREYGLRNPIAIIPNGVDPARPASGRVPAWRSGIPEDQKILLFLGRLHPKKGLLPLLERLDRLWNEPRCRADEWTLVIAGWSQNNHQHELEEWTRERGLQSRVRFAGPLHGQDKTDAFHAADAFVLPSHSEGLPVAVLEAWAHGLPVAMTAACNIEQGFASDAAVQLGWTPDGQLTGLHELFEMSSGGRTEMGDRGLSLVGREFDWRQIGARFLTLYQWLTGDAPVPDFVELV